MLYVLPKDMVKIMSLEQKTKNFESLQLPISEEEYKERRPEGRRNQIERPDKIARIKRICDLVEEYHRGGPILEIGSFPYNITTILELKGYDPIGIDKNTDVMSEYIAERNLDIRECDIEREALPFDEQSFSIVILTEVIEHLRINPLETMRRIRRVVSDDGVLILSTPNLYSIMNIYSYLRGDGLSNMHTGYKTFNQLEEMGYPGHFHVYSESELDEMLSHTGFRTADAFYTGVPRSKRYTPLNLICRLRPKLKKRVWIVATPDT